MAAWRAYINYMSINPLIISSESEKEKKMNLNRNGHGNELSAAMARLVNKKHFNEEENE